MLIGNNARSLGATVVSKMDICADDGALLSYRVFVKTGNRPGDRAELGVQNVPA